MMVSVFRPDAGDDFLFDGDLNVDGVAFLLVFFVALLVWDLFCSGEPCTKSNVVEAPFCNEEW